MNTWVGGRKLHGHCKMTYSDGSVFEGEYKDGNANGHGKMTYPDGRVFDGEFKDGKSNGHGKMTYPNGDVFEGEFKDDVYDMLILRIENNKRKHDVHFSDRQLKAMKLAKK
jgi:hypothetical protein